MRKEIPPDYPAQIDDQTLTDLISKYSYYATGATRSDGYSLGPNYWKEMASLGQAELSNRIQSKLNNQIQLLTNEIAILKDDNKKSGRINSILSFLTILLAVITSVFGLYTFEFSKTSQEADNKWKSDLLSVIKKNNSLITDIKQQALTRDTIITP